MNDGKLNCVIMGTESLLIQCANILLERGHDVKAIVSTAVPIIDWAEANNIPCVPSRKGLANALKAYTPFDYFFSITNLSIVPDDVLALPGQKAINFHDGPLPQYAGLYATSWALMNQESTHGVSWHTMTAEVDKGEILKQRLFEIDADETAFTMNVKAYEAAINSFTELVAELENDTVQPQPQDLAEQTYYGKYKRPSAAATIDWNQPAADISALVRALDFDAYANPLALPKLWMGSEVFIMPQVEVLASESANAPGMVTAVTAESITVSTASNDIRIGTLQRMNGTSISLADFVTQFHLQSGSQLPTLDAETAVTLTALNNAIIRQEAFWVRRLSKLETATLPYANHTNGPALYQGATTTIPAAVKQYLSGQTGALTQRDFVTVAFAAYLARLSGNTYFDLGLSHHTLQQKVAGFESYFATTVPMRVNLDLATPVSDVMASLHAELDMIVQKRKTFAWDTLIRYPELGRIKSLEGKSPLPIVVQQVETIQAQQPLPGSELTLLVTDAGDEVCWLYDTAVYSADDIAAMQRQFGTFLQNLVATDDNSLASTLLLTEAEYRQIMVAWNETQVDYDKNVCVHQLIETQAEERPVDIAIVYEDQQLTYNQLNKRANQLARYLRHLGVGPDTVVGVFMERSLELMISLLGILKAGGAYLPLDPTYPQDRLAFMVEDAQTPVLLTQARLVAGLPPHQAEVVRVDADWDLIADESVENVYSGVTPDHLSYVIYTSGSTGKPKGVMVEHGNVVNFFVGMDERIPHHPPGTWLAVTSLSFDISVLELFWTLSRGFKVVIYDDKTREEATPTHPHADKAIDFSLFYFASDESEEGVADKYNLLLEGAKYGDRHGFAAVWTPERHFHAFGGLYPNPSVASAAIAAITENIRIRSGSCVLPLHHPVRVVEEWSLVDNISKGRVGISFASGWQPNDFILRPENHADRKAIMFRDIEVVKKLWRGESMTFPGPDGNDVEIRTLPRPIQPELPVWVTAAGNPETFRMAGEGGFHILTHLLGQTVEQLAEKLEIYRQGWRDGGHEGEGHVTLMLHTFVGDDIDEVRNTVRQPMKEYLRSAVFLIKQAAWHFPTFKQKAAESGKNPMELFESDDLTDEEMEALLEFAFNRYFETSGLFGTPTSCLEMVNKLKDINVDEIACQIDFGVPSAKVLTHLVHLNELKRLAMPKTGAEDYTIPAQIERHKVTHFQCTPSMASMLLMDERTKAALSSLQTMMVGGEALPVTLANQLREIVPGNVINMYGPTETTIWSSTHQLNGPETAVPIGRPIANTSIYILDQQMQPVPVGVAGDLYIGGDGVVRGYLNRETLTAERFIDPPFSSPTVGGTEGGRRLYKTGDLARYRPDGNIDFLGRADFQVKIRGFRIELGEIETVLNEHDSVREAVVVAREDVPGDKRLVAYLIPKTGQKIVSKELRHFLRTELPEFMVPSHFIKMDSFPLTPNKKTDRKALPAPDQVASETNVAYMAPTNDLERKVAEIWQRLLNVNQVGLNDNFFDLGGHSLLTVQAHRQLKAVVDREISITDMFRFPTIRSLVAYLSEDTNGSNGTKKSAVAKSSDRAATRREALKQRQHRRRR